MTKKKERTEILELIRNRSCLKRDIYENTVKQFEELKIILSEYVIALKKDIAAFDSRIRVEYVVKSKGEVHLIVAGDILVFHMHSNIFLFNKDHYVWQTSYVQETEKNAFVGTINVYNFLNDSLKYKRMDDLGYLIARVFINRENHYFTEGKKELGYKFNNFVESILSKKDWIEIINTCLSYTIDFNLLVPPYREISLISVAEVLAKGAELQVKTGKRLGFQFSNDNAQDIH